MLLQQHAKNPMEDHEELPLEIVGHITSHKILQLTLPPSRVARRKLVERCLTRWVVLGLPSATYGWEAIYLFTKCVYPQS